MRFVQRHTFRLILLIQCNSVVFIKHLLQSIDCLHRPKAWQPNKQQRQEKLPINRKKPWAGPGSYWVALLLVWTPQYDVIECCVFAFATKKDDVRQSRHLHIFSYCKDVEALELTSQPASRWGQRSLHLNPQSWLPLKDYQEPAAGFNLQHLILAVIHLRLVLTSSGFIWTRFFSVNVSFNQNLYCCRYVWLFHFLISSYDIPAYLDHRDITQFYR